MTTDWNSGTLDPRELTSSLLLLPLVRSEQASERTSIRSAQVEMGNGDPKDISGDGHWRAGDHLVTGLTWGTGQLKGKEASHLKTEAQIKHQGD